MTPEERTRMNELCVQIQNEKNYQRFEELIREATALMSAKERRFPESKLALAGTGHKTLHATATRIMRALDARQAETVEIRVADAEPLYSEIRIENSFTDDRGNTLAIQPPAPLDITVRAPADRLAIKRGD